MPRQATALPALYEIRVGAGWSRVWAVGALGTRVAGNCTETLIKHGLFFFQHQVHPPSSRTCSPSSSAAPTPPWVAASWPPGPFPTPAMAASPPPPALAAPPSVASLPQPPPRKLRPPTTRGAAGGGESGGGATGPEESSADEDDRSMTQKAADAMRRAKGHVKAAAGESD